MKNLKEHSYPLLISNYYHDKEKIRKELNELFKLKTKVRFT